MQNWLYFITPKNSMFIVWVLLFLELIWGYIINQFSLWRVCNMTLFKKDFTFIYKVDSFLKKWLFGLWSGAGISSFSIISIFLLSKFFNILKCIKVILSYLLSHFCIYISKNYIVMKKIEIIQNREDPNSLKSW
jgi:hypothetical protein